MSKEKSDFRLVADKSKAGTEPAALRLTKTVRGSDESTYTLLLPGVVPDPLKLSIHPNGEIQLKSRSAGLITRLDKDALVRGLLSGSLDDALARLLTPLLVPEPAEGFVLGSDLLAIGRAGMPLEDVDVSIGRFLDGLTKVRVEDTTKLGECIARLRDAGLMPVKSTLQLVTETSDRQIVFLSVVDRPLGELTERPPLPEGFPFPKAFRALLGSLACYGGILFAMPSEPEVVEMARAAGLGDLLSGIARFADALSEPDVEEKVGRVILEIAAGFAGPVSRVARAKPIRPLRSPKKTRETPTPPPGGWVRRRPRRRGHTARLPLTTD